MDITKSMNVAKYMKMIENATAYNEYREFEIALLIAERSNLSHLEINDDIIIKIDEILNTTETLFNDSLNNELEKIFDFD